ncbi:MAG: HAMP domain-containing histidine kinase [Chitinophagales bacterium]|jgi:two-component system phosphate regulon sensor histidine kinase PhoR|nr:HAMP domain-containing histidine kinase [Chitinophagales bacterium]
MKRTLPLIVILISISLLGLVVLQVSWVKNILEVRKGQILSKVDEAGVAVSADLSRAMYTIPGKRSLLKRFGIGSDLSMRLLKTPSVAEKFSKKDIEEKIHQALKGSGIEKVDVEFAIINMYGNAEMVSNNFAQKFYDTTHNKLRFYAIIPESLMELDAMNSYENLALIVPDFNVQVWESLRWVIVGAVVFMLVIFTAFYITLSALLNQKKLSEIKSDFINNMTHELKTPLATIALAVDAVRNEKVQSNKEKLDYFTSIIKEENVRMNKHVETILQSALMDRQELRLQPIEIDVHLLLHSLVDNYELQLADKQGSVEWKLNAATHVVEADETHFTNMLSNLLDNAIKYSKEQLLIRISTHSTHKHMVIRIEDNGIGMNKETVKRIFEKFYRAHTGNVHNVKGFGLGMSYVKSVIDAHKGRIKVDSTPGKGSSFIVEIPLKAKP